LPPGFSGELEAVKQRCRGTIEAQLQEHEALLFKLLQRHEEEKRQFAAAPPAQPAAAGKWVRAECYYNVETMETQWDVPDDLLTPRGVLLACPGLAERGGRAPGGSPINVTIGAGAARKTDGEAAQVLGNCGKLSMGERRSAGEYRAKSAVDLRMQDLLHSVQSPCLTRCIFGFRDWAQIKEPERTGILARLVNGAPFDFLCCFCIMLYSVWLLRAADIAVETLSEDLSPLMSMGERLFLWFFCVELLLRLLVHRLYFFCNEDWKWNVFDFMLVAVAAHERFTACFLQRNGKGGISLTFLRSLRMLKMVRALRVLKMLRFVTELSFMINSVLGSITSLFWSLVMLAMMFFLFSLAFVQGVGLYLIEVHETISPEERDGLIVHFGSVLRSMSTCFRSVTGGDDWGVFYDVIKPTGFLNCAIFFFFIMFSQIALLNIVTGVFVENAMKLGQPELGQLAFEQRKKDLEDAAGLRQVFHFIDADGSGTLTADEFHDCIQDERVKARLAVLGLSIKDAERFFRMLTDIGSTPAVDLDFFVDACLKMKGVASSIDLQTLAYETRIIHQSLERLHEETRSAIQEVRDVLDERADGNACPPPVSSEDVEIQSTADGTDSLANE